MHRIRMSLPFFEKFGWEVEVITVDEKYVEGYRDILLNETVPKEIVVHKVKALQLKYTRKIGLGSLSIRSYYYFKKKGNELLKKNNFDLVYFSTTMFHVCALGRYWKKKFNIPFVIDLQDPWRNDFYLSKPVSERPPKFWLAYNIHKYMEAYTMPHVDGIISVSKGYIDSIKDRYAEAKDIPSLVLPFGCADKDFELVKSMGVLPEIITKNPSKINVVYIGAVTKNFIPILKAFFTCFKNNISNYNDYHFYFIGTNYATVNTISLVEELAMQMNIEQIVTEIPKRISYFSSIATMQQADILLIPGSMDVDYNASKVYNNILAGKPIFSIFNNRSLVKQVIENTNSGIVVGVNGDENEEELVKLISNKIEKFKKMHLEQKNIDFKLFSSFSAEFKTKEQVVFFNEAIKNRNYI
jgi:Glycosyltransferase Family 4